MTEDCRNQTIYFMTIQNSKSLTARPHLRLLDLTRLEFGLRKTLKKVKARRKE